MGVLLQRERNYSKVGNIFEMRPWAENERLAYTRARFLDVAQVTFEGGGGGWDEILRSTRSKLLEAHFNTTRRMTPGGVGEF